MCRPRGSTELWSVVETKRGQECSDASDASDTSETSDAIIGQRRRARATPSLCNVYSNDITLLSQIFLKTSENSLQIRVLVHSWIQTTIDEKESKTATNWRSLREKEEEWQGRAVRERKASHDKPTGSSGGKPCLHWHWHSKARKGRISSLG